MEKNFSDESFFLSVTGQVERGDFGAKEDLYCRYSFHFGPDWTIVSGLHTGLSQIARKSSLNCMDGVVWNFPVDVTFRSTNVFGWPRIAINVYGIDFLGRDVVVGYVSVLVPPVNGLHELEVDCYVPLASSIANTWLSWLLGSQPEFFDSKFVCQGEGREVTRVQATGSVRLKLTVLTKGMQAVGYSSNDQPAFPQTSFPDLPTRPSG
mmetsp:Transcript_40095/g.40892  ORF Transcript_40095/g.40892 Transcript_40095/m.40892 type:complete len:208 (-) Transcript_40095:306-929(-)